MNEPSKSAPAGIPGMAGPPGTFRFLGLEIAEIDREKGFCKLTAAGRADLCNPAGVMQGGILTAMLDDAMSISAVAQHDFKVLVPTLDLRVNFLRPVFPGSLTVEGEVVRAGRRIVYLAGRIFDAGGKLSVVANATAQFRTLKS